MNTSNRHLPMAGGQGFALAGLLTVLPTPWLAVNIVSAVALLALPGVMVWLDRRERMPTALPWIQLLLVTPLLAYSTLMITFQPNSYCNTILPHEDFRGFYVLFLPFVPLFAHMLGSEKVGRPWLFGCILTLSLLFVFDLTVAYEVLHMVYQNQAGEGVVYSGARAWECNHFNGESMQVAFQAKWRANQIFLVLMPVLLVGARLVNRWRRDADNEVQKENSEV
tara:strand:- start:447 stop:1115 length:669 start_codon:yes stop_codon:yes gene_type:complete